MFFKRLIRLSMAIVLFSTGCGLKVGEKPPKRTPPAYSGNGFSCVGQIPQHIDLYVKDQLTDAQISSFVRCLQKAFTTFGQLTRGRDAATYTPEEIRRFLHEFFLGERKISDSLLREFMVIKQVMVGGSLTRITRPELQAAVAVLEELRLEAIKLKPYIRILNPYLALKDQDPATMPERLDQANEALRSAIQTVSRRLRQGNRDYPLKNLREFMIEFREFAGWERHFQSSLPVDRWVDFVSTFRQLVVRVEDSADTIRPREWGPMLQAFREWYMIYLQYQWGVKGQSILQGRGLDSVVRMGRDLFAILESTVDRHKNREVPFEKFELLAKALEGVNWLPGQVKAESVAKVARIIVTRTLGAQDTKPSERRATALKPSAIAQAKEIFTQWSTIQVELASGRAVSTMRGSDWDELRKAGEHLRPLFPDNTRHVLLAPESKLNLFRTRRESFTNLSLIHIWRTAVKLIFRSYADEVGGRSDWNAGMTADELEQFYVDFRDLGVGLGLVDPRNKEVGKRAFIEGKLFTYSAKGFRYGCVGPETRISLAEMIELFTYLYSGSGISNKIYEDLAKSCDQGPLDSSKRAMIDRGCVQRELPSLLDEHLINMPEFRQFLTLSQSTQRQAYAETLLNMAKVPDVSDESWVELSELNMMIVVLHYLEAIMTRYDVKGDGILDNDDIEAAEGIFPGFFQKFYNDDTGKELSQANAVGVLYYLLLHRAFPPDYSTLGYWEWTKEVTYMTKLRVWGAEKLSINRADLVDVMNVIIPKIFANNKKKMQLPKLLNPPPVRPKELPACQAPT